MNKLTKYNSDFDYKRTVIEEKYINPFYKELPQILTNLSLEDNNFKIIMDKDLTKEVLLNSLVNIKDINDLFIMTKKFLIERGATFES